MLEDHAKIAALIHQSEDYLERKKLQKIVYILQRFGCPFNQKFHFYFSGPYSEELSIQLDELCDFGFLIEDWTSRSDQAEQCAYRISEAGEDFLSHYKDELPKTPLIQRVMGQKTSFLECTAMLLFFDQLPQNAAFDKVRTLEKNDEVCSFLEPALTFLSELRAARAADVSVF
ncbi:YwgA family protein [Sporolactobacillus inulinus]|uniref:YwgA n=1 Tax=Sporolactobacillus inulinus CASD TaxID=1069536 RepID=A0A0U1QKT1_9BACL|nr:hypothetical protein [Sporolactobacillus inulinus]KLI01361.1 hypothetical protein SINU_13875 [Sporolactobacillus inulinus CASD]GEB78238.1 hypothetical protein SIN01_25830 [Sporolactobacillus inulinus]